MGVACAWQTGSAVYRCICWSVPARSTIDRVGEQSDVHAFAVANLVSAAWVWNSLAKFMGSLALGCVSVLYRLASRI